MSLSPRVGDLCWRMGVWGPPSMTLSPGEVGQGWVSLSPSPLTQSPSLPPAPRFFGVSLYIALWRDRGGRMDGVWGG